MSGEDALDRRHAVHLHEFLRRKPLAKGFFERKNQIEMRYRIPSRGILHGSLFVQGGGDGVHDRWDNRLVESLRASLGSGYRIRYPEMPNEADPAYSAWSRALQAELAACRPPISLHACRATLAPWHRNG